MPWSEPTAAEAGVSSVEYPADAAPAVLADTTEMASGPTASVGQRDNAQERPTRPPLPSSAPTVQLSRDIVEGFTPRSTPGTLPPPSSNPPRRGRYRSLVALVVALVAVAGIAGAYLIGSRTSDRKAIAPTPTAKSPVSVVTSVPPTVTTQSTTTTRPSASPRQQAAALDGLLAKTAAVPAQVVKAVGDTGACTALPAAQQSLQAVVLTRTSLLNRLRDLQLDQVPNSSTLVATLTAAWQASIQSDRSYAAWAGDRIANGCGPDTGTAKDANYLAAQQTDQAAGQAKHAFVIAWNPVASGFGLSARSEDQL